ncbi:MAG: DUF1350 family protein [Synechococcaceae cyanobacterium SM2_3_1]|nr:DUF1350 family protein [Synechococcaceae cyanobacterium SM2_3_1]
MSFAWQQIDNSWIKIPPHPRAVIHALGGALVGSAPQIFYQAILERLVREGYAVVATAFNTSPDHWSIAEAIHRSWSRVCQEVPNLRSLPLFGLGHSLGCKLHILCSVLNADQPRQGNILIAYSNASFRQSLPWGDLIQLGLEGVAAPPLEFDPSPEQTIQLIQSSYPIQSHLLIKFERDTIDEIEPLYQQLLSDPSKTATLLRLPGDHGTSVAGSYPFTSSIQLTPLDVFGQFIYQNLITDNHRLGSTLITWLGDQMSTD